MLFPTSFTSAFTAIIKIMLGLDPDSMRNRQDRDALVQDQKKNLEAFVKRI